MLYIISIAKTASKKIGALIHSISFFLLRLLFVSINLPYSHAWNTVVMSGLVLLVATSNCWISYKSRCAGLLILHFLPLFKPLLIVEIEAASDFPIGVTFVHVPLKWLNWFHFLILKGGLLCRGLLCILIDCMTFCHHS